MTLRLRLTIASALAVALTIGIASGVVYVVMRAHLRSNVDQQLRGQFAQVQQNRALLHTFESRSFSGPFDIRSGPTVGGLYMQAVRDDGITALTSYESAKVPVTKTTLRVASNQHGPFFSEATIDGRPSRVYTVYLGAMEDGHGVALQFVRSVEDVRHTLDRLRWILLLVFAGGLAVGAAGGALVSRTTLSPVRRLTETAERIARTGDPSERVDVGGGDDELGRLGTTFNTMLAALEESLETQRRFVADASHELRTPLTSLQTNIEVLKQQERLDPDQRARLFADLEREAHEMRDLITGLLELARGDATVERSEVQFDDLVESAVDRARSRFPTVHFNAHLERTVVDGIPDRLDRAVWNLLENAGKWTAPGTSVDVTLENGELRVRDHGPGIALEDRDHVFDRFYRAPAARSLPGSGLGLAIVREVAEAHGGAVTVEDAPGGGALMRFHLNGSTRRSSTS
ncbi:MAG TPA: HAMP domain-containing sensor histidine kinase [Gaiellaceae bacterium]|nr:HAMP domain-containing sensor histidine kinase [Gaiellaceae bacterium]